MGYFPTGEVGKKTNMVSSKSNVKGQTHERSIVGEKFWSSFQNVIVRQSQQRFGTNNKLILLTNATS